MRKRLVSSFGVVLNSPKYGKYNEDRLLFPELEQSKRHGINKQCPCCGQYNFIAFRPAVRTPSIVLQDGTKVSGNKIIARINWVTCSKCKVSYSLD